jgi:hypothetical protein
MAASACRAARAPGAPSDRETPSPGPQRMGEFGRSGPQLPHDKAALQEHLKEIQEDLRPTTRPTASRERGPSGRNLIKHVPEIGNVSGL